MLISDFLIKGTSIEGNRMEIEYLKKNNIKINYIWQISVSSEWINVSKLNFYDIKSKDVNKKIRCLITYYDSENFLESISTKVWIIQEKVKLLKIDAKEDKLVLSFNKNIKIDKDLKLNLSNDIIAEYKSSIKSNIIEFKIINSTNLTGKNYISSFNKKIIDEHDIELSEEYKTILIDYKSPIISILKNVPSFNSNDSISFMFLSSKSGSITYEGISNNKFSLENAVEGKNVTSLDNIKDGKYNIKVKITDVAGNESNTLEINPFTIWNKKPNLKKVSLYSLNKDPKMAKPGDIIYLIIKAENFVNIQNIQIMRKFMKINMLDDGSYISEYKVGTKDSGKIKFKVTYKSITGILDETFDTTDESYIMIDTSIPKINFINFYSNNNNSLKINDFVFLDLEFDQDVDPTILIYDKIPIIEKISNSKYLAKLKIDESFNTNYENSYVINFISFNNIKGETVTKNTNNFKFLLDKPILKEVKSIGTSYNSSPIYIFESNEEGKLFINDKLNCDVKFIREGNNCIKFNNLENNTYNEFLYVENKYGNRSKLYISEFKIVNDDSQIELVDLSIKSDHINNNIAKIGNVVTIMFTTNKKVKAIDIDFEVSGKKTNFMKNIQNIFNECFWSIEFLINPNTPYGNLLFNLRIKDDNDFILKTNNTIKKASLTIINPNYENLKSDFDMLHNKLDNIDNYIEELNLNQIENIIDIIDNTIYPNDVFYVWQEKNKDNWNDIKSSNDSKYEIDIFDLGKTLRVKMYFIDENKNLNFKYSNEFLIKEDNKIISMN